MTADEIEKDLCENLSALEREAVRVYEELVLPNWGKRGAGLGRTVHAYMAATLAHVDLASAYWKGSTADQTHRMEAFLSTNCGADAEAARVLVKMWRHVLMHTAKPRKLSRPGGTHYYWLLQWREHLPRHQHLSFSDAHDSRNLNIGLLYLLADLRVAAEGLVASLRRDRSGLTAALAVHKKINSQRAST